MRNNSRDLRVADFIRDELASIIQLQMRDPRVGLVMVNEVSVSKDLSWADIYITSMDAVSEEDQTELIAVLNKAAGYFRSELARRHTMRTTPKPRFHYDETVERGPRLEALIDSVVKSDREAAANSDRQEDEDGQET